MDDLIPDEIRKMIDDAERAEALAAERAEKQYEDQVAAGMQVFDAWLETVQVPEWMMAYYSQPYEPYEPLGEYLWRLAHTGMLTQPRLLFDVPGLAPLIYDPNKDLWGVSGLCDPLMDDDENDVMCGGLVESLRQAKNILARRDMRRARAENKKAEEDMPMCPLVNNACEGPRCAWWVGKCAVAVALG